MLARERTLVVSTHDVGRIDALADTRLALA
jgi:hypothetical protein